MRMWILAFIVSTVLTVGANTQTFTGDLTTYTLSHTMGGNCNFMHAPPQAVTNYAALNDPQWASTKNCGRCARVSCSDARCANKNKSELVYIVDRCPECKHGDLDVSLSVFNSLTGSNPSRYKISWRFVDCPISGNIKYCLKGGSNPYWTAIQPTNVPSGVAKMTIDSRATSMVPSAYYHLVQNVMVNLRSVKVSLTSLTGEVVTETVSLTPGTCTTGTKQFTRK